MRLCATREPSALSKRCQPRTFAFQFFACLAVLTAVGVTTARAARAEDGGTGVGNSTGGARTIAIDIIGARRVSADTVHHYLQLQRGGRYDAGQINGAVKRLYATGQFADVRIEQAGGRLIVRLVESPTVAKLTIEGNSAIREKDVRSAAALSPRATYSRALAHAAETGIKTLYRAREYQDVAVKIRSDPMADNRLAIVISIREGAVVKIGAIDFRGNRAIRSRELADVVTTRPAGMFDFLKAITPYDEARLDLDRELIVQHYFTRGYADVKVERARAVRDPKSGTWRIAFVIDEGQRYRLGTVSLKDRRARADAAGRLQRQTDVRSGDVWNKKAVDATIERLTQTLVADGDMRAEVVAVPGRDPATQTIDLAFEVRERPRMLIERIDISGNTKTRDEVIRREMRLAEGDQLHPLLLAQARARLLRLGLFKSVDITAKPGAAHDRQVVIVRVVEQSSNEIGFGIGYSTQEGVTGDISFTERNLFGRGQYLIVKLAGSQKRAEGEIGFTEPYFLGRKLAAGFDLFYRDIDSIETSSYKSTRAGGRVRLGFDVATNTTATLNYTFARTTIYDVGANASSAIKQAVPGYPQATSAAYDTSSVGYTLAYDTRDDARNPMQGLYIATTQDLAGLGGDARYLRTVIDARGYYPIAGRTGMATRVIGGTIAGYGGSDVRLLDQFYRGGETIRGFATSGIGPRDVLSTNRDALGGANFLATSAELRFPVPFMPSELGGLRGAIFADAGSLWGVGGAAKGVPGVVGTSAALRASTGAGLIWDSPLGPLRVDYAQVLVKQAFDKTQPLRFGLGPGF